MVLHGSLNNIWSLKTSQRNSWLANKIIKIRDVAFHWIKFRVENGKNCRFWYDNWSPFGSLHVFLQGAASFQFGLYPLVTLHDLRSPTGWLLPLARSENQVLLQAYLSTISLSSDEDSYEWVMDDVIMTKFSTGQVYNAIREHRPTIPWYQAVWNKRGIPKHSFLTWLFVLDRCPTRNRLLNWGLITDPNCLLCNSSLEDRDHVFFGCSFSWRI
ncbi:unnamed protein product [Arabis nemorensis]|uniref:Reverse transcriptase zinc-binding domain-containing protein n=1 Tax=Arabis nemorensis TaxID=586526 RepID=A0A565C5N3_9BRAS|nr:unnamed protein product [Arabis nemorensis]